MEHPQNDRHLHLERVGKDECVVRSVPGGIDTKRIVRLGRDRLHYVTLIEHGRELEVRLGESKREGEDIIIH